MKIKRTIRGLDEELYNQARANALKRGDNIGDWMNEAMRLRFSAIKRVRISRGRGENP